MVDFAVVTDSSCDLSEELVKELELTVVELSYTLNGKEYGNGMDGAHMTVAEFYRHLREGEPCTTSAVNVDSFMRATEPLLQQGRDVLNIAFSSGLSNTCNAARMACEELSAKYPERKVVCIDSLAASLGQGLLVYLAVQQKRAGRTLQETADWVEQNKLHLCHWFTVDDLKFLKRGGRISGTTALIGSMLSIKPVLHVDNAGHLINVGKVRGRRASLDALVDHMEQTAVNPAEQTVFISHGDSAADAEYVASEVKRRMGVKKVFTGYVGPVIGAHSGPGTMALFFLGDNR